MPAVPYLATAIADSDGFRSIRGEAWMRTRPPRSLRWLDIFSTLLLVRTCLGFRIVLFGTYLMWCSFLFVSVHTTWRIGTSCMFYINEQRVPHLLTPSSLFSYFLWPIYYKTQAQTAILPCIQAICSCVFVLLQNVSVLFPISHLTVTADEIVYL